MPTRWEDDGKNWDSIRLIQRICHTRILAGALEKTSTPGHLSGNDTEYWFNRIVVDNGNDVYIELDAVSEWREFIQPVLKTHIYCWFWLSTSVKLFGHFAIIPAMLSPENNHFLCYCW